MNESIGQYRPSEIEPKWQSYWEQHQTFRVSNPGDPEFDPRTPKYYILDMFPYTSGSGLHVGHPEGYTATDILSRYKRMKGFNVLHPIGWDSFGLPAEQYAVQTNVHPRVTTENAIKNFKKQLKRFGFSYDWNRELATTDLKYYKWTQWIFLKLFNSWFDERAEGHDESGRPYQGKARPISELIHELEKGNYSIDHITNDLYLSFADHDSSQPGWDKSRLKKWNELSINQQRNLIDNHRLAYLAEVPVNWCPMLGTVLANEEVTNEGRSERGDYPVFRRPLKQWMLRITQYAERLITDIDHVDWPEPIKAMQRNWVGKSVGAEVLFKLAKPISNEESTIPIFTTRPDTLFGATYMVLAPEHPLVEKITAKEQSASVQKYVEIAKNKTDLDRTAETKEKTGVLTGAYAINPVNSEQIPIWVADYVLMGYGTGAIMAVPGQDQRDWDFAKKFDLPIIRTVQPPPDFSGEAYLEDGPAMNSDFLNGKNIRDAKLAMVDFLEEKGLGRRKVNYKLRDWLFSRQRYWGEPFPILHGPGGELVALDESELPLDLPHMDDFKPHASEDPGAPPQPPLGRAKDWISVKRNGKTYTRELNTMPQWAGSCWYYLRYLDSQNDHAAWRNDIEKYWMNVDQYVGGAEHAVLHLLYARFWHKVLYDLGHVSTAEPFQRLFNQGLILSFAYKDRRGAILGMDQVEERGENKFFSKETGEPVEQIVAKMSKSLKNIVNPDDILNQFGADTFRLYEMYMGPLDAAKPWNTRDIPGLHRFLQRVWRLVIDEQTNQINSAVQDVDDPASLRLLHKMIKKVGEDIEEFKFNTAIAEMITFTNEMTGLKTRSRKILETFVLVLSPFTPHLAEELWQRLGHDKTLAYEPWPTYDSALAKDTEIEIVVQISGKVKSRLRVAADVDDRSLEAAALADGKVKSELQGKTVRKVIVVPKKLVNIVAN